MVYLVYCAIPSDLKGGGVTDRASLALHPALTSRALSNSSLLQEQILTLDYSASYLGLKHRIASRTSNKVIN